MMKFLSLITCLATAMAGNAFAGSIMNMDKTAHKVEFTYVGYTKETVVLAPGEVRRFQDPWLEISLGGMTTQTDYRSEFVIQNGRLVLMWIRDSRGGGIF